ncbi:ankyrin repeat and zinc finger domain-containing protein 1-like [Elysia marginata]|uniref:Ankyrin repeat and zinc finger domain-containing protein 1-like n=1 Tax=Elysia marginata TaxID=1093978 RepID=A0AAV4HT64_9GAST|nr:ankyrin repeat and zinc finger domain-containing protein 1-like [Elysia marginata]
MEQTKNTPGHEHYSNQSLFDIKVRSILDGLDLASCNTSSCNMAEIETRGQTQSVSTLSICTDITTKLVVSESKFCNSCQVQFDDREEQVLHYKSDWHRYNLHLRVRGAPSVTEDHFETMSGDVSSISGSDDEEDVEEQSSDVTEGDNLTPLSENEPHGSSSSRQRESQKVYFTNKNGELLSVYRCLLHHKKNPIEETEQLISAVTELPKKLRWAVLMVTCGHFAGAIFDGNEVLEHKTFHRYTSRRKRGTAQSSFDSKGRAAKSGGAHLRRYNEAALVQEVQELLNKWQDLLDSCHFVFVRIPVANRGMFFSGKNAPLKKDDLRIRVIPFPTRRPTFSELKRVQQVLSTVESYGNAADVGPVFPRSPRRYFNKDSGQLEIQPQSLDAKQQTGKVKARPGSAKSKTQEPSESPMQIVPEVQKDEEEEEEESSLNLVETKEEISFSGLKEFEHTPKKKRNKRKEKETQSKIEDFSLGEREIRWKNSLFTASKTGNENIFKIIVNEMIDHHTYCATSVENEGSCESQSLCGKDSSLPSQGLVLSDNQSLKTTPPSQGCPSEGNHPNGIVLTSPEALSGNGHPDGSLERVAAFFNKPLGDGGQTLLHVASQENQAQVIHLLLEHGADPAIKDKAGRIPYNLAGSESRNSFRRFMSLWPDKYDYAKAQEKKEALAKEREEEKEKERFLALSDREKRALAAERRILQQHSTDNNSSKPVLRRCWGCAIDITGKVPFEYSDYKFCSTKCLREHRSKAK